MSRKLVYPPSPASVKDDQGSYIPAPGAPPPPAPDLNLDSMRQRGLAALDRLLRCVTSEVSAGNPSRETVQNLKDILGMINDLKDIERDELSKMSEEDLLKAMEE